MNSPKHNRRQFSSAALSVGLGAFSGLSSRRTYSEDRPAASDRLNVAVIGLGGRGFNLIDELLAQPDVEIRVVCDVEELHNRDLEQGQGRAMGREGASQYLLSRWNKSGLNRQSGPETSADFREVCARDDLDAIVIATPDHWHLLCALEAIEAGKDVYGEKPITHWFSEGLILCQQVDKYQRIFQTGSQQRSHWEFRRIAELVRNGLLGRIHSVEIGLLPGYAQPQGDIQAIPPPEDLDYELWCGPAPVLPYMRARHHRWWRGHRAFGGGTLMDWIGHHNDIAHWALDLDSSGPEEVEAIGWQFPATDVYNTPSVFEIACRYSGGITSSISSQHNSGLRISGDAGWCWVDRGKIKASNSQWTKREFDPGAIRLQQSPGHMRNFLDSVKSRQQPITTAEIGHCSITPGHLAFVSHALGRKLRWDAANQQVLGDRSANEMLRAGEYRDPWKLPVIPPQVSVEVRS